MIRIQKLLVWIQLLMVSLSIVACMVSLMLDAKWITLSTPVCLVFLLVWLITIVASMAASFYRERLERRYTLPPVKSGPSVQTRIKYGDKNH